MTTPAATSEAPFITTDARPLWHTVVLLALPVLAQQFLILTVGLSDRFLAGHFQAMDPASAESAQHITYQSAQTTAHYLAWFISSYTVLVSVGSTALVARCIGAGNRAEAVHVTHQSLLLGLMLGIAGTTIGLLGLDFLVRLLQLQGESAQFAADYLRPLIVLLTFQVVEAAGIACLVGAGDTVTGLVVMSGVALLNLPLAWGLCLGYFPLPRLGFVGISLGTAICHVFACLAVLIVLWYGRAGLRLELNRLKPDVGTLRRLLRISVPAGIDSLSTVAGQLWFLSIVNRLGDVASAAHGIALGWEALGYLSGAAFGTAAMTLVGQNLGAERPDRAARSGWVAFGMGCALMGTMGVILCTFAPAMFTLFCPLPSQRPIIDAGVPVLRLVAFAQPALASTIIFTYALRGAGDTRTPVLFTWIGFLGIRIPLAYLLTTTFHIGESFTIEPGLFGAWLAMFADIVVRGCFFLLRFASGRWQRIRV